MRRVLSLLCFGLVLACATSSPRSPGALPVASPESEGMSGERLARLDRKLDAYVEAGRIPGYQLLVARNGHIVHERSRGLRDREAGAPVESDTLFRIYSMSKVVTGAATLIAMEQGLFRLDEPVSRYLPELAEPSVLVREPDGSSRVVPAKGEIRILDLLRHTSGLTYAFIGPPEISRQYRAAGIAPGIRGVPKDTRLGADAGRDGGSLADMVKALGDIPLVAEPGTRWNYGISLDVLGRLIEVTSGQPFPDFLEAKLFEPLGMRDTAFYVPAEKLGRFAASYGPTPQGGMRLLDAPATSEYREPPEMPGGGGGLVSTAGDYLRFALMLENDGKLDGVRVLSRKSVDLMMADHMPVEEFGSTPLGAMGERFANGGRGVSFGLSGAVFTDPAATALPISAGLFSWGGAASTFFWVDRSEDLAVVFMTQLIPSGTYPLRAELMLLTYQAIVD